MSLGKICGLRKMLTRGFPLKTELSQNTSANAIKAKELLNFKTDKEFQD